LDFAPAIALLIVSTVGIFVAAFSPSGDHGQYAVVAPPWYGFAQTIGLIDAAGGDIVEFGDLTNIAIVHSANPGFVRALYHAGAWLVIDPLGLRGCFGFGRNAMRQSGGI
jgi:hypothetical protein